MRTKAGEKEKLRGEILKDSVKTFKKFGHAGAPVDQIMKRAGLTSGALYSHFKGKDDLFLQATLLDFDNLLSRYREIVDSQGSKGLKTIVDEYLSEAHVERVEQGCLFAALSPDIHRAKVSKKSGFEERYEALVEILATGFSKGTPSERKKKAITLFSMMVGTMSVCRMLHPQESIDEILQLGKKQAYNLMDI